jgi:hypothetical protein
MSFLNRIRDNSNSQNNTCIIDTYAVASLRYRLHLSIHDDTKFYEFERAPCAIVDCIGGWLVNIIRVSIFKLTCKCLLEIQCIVLSGRTAYVSYNTILRKIMLASSEHNGLHPMVNVHIKTQVKIESSVSQSSRTQQEFNWTPHLP